MKKIKRLLLSKRFLIGLVACVQIVLFVFITSELYIVGSTAYILLTIFSVFVMLYLFEKDNMNPSYKIIWILFMAVFPISGAALYFFCGDTKLTRKQQEHINGILDRSHDNITPNPRLCRKISLMDGGLGRQAYYLENTGFSPPYENTAVKYYDIGAAMFRDYLNDLKNARKSIFIQYFIIDEGYMWDRIMEVLKEKVADGVDVRVVYDGFGTLLTLPEDYEKTLRAAGIKAYIFNDVKFSIHIGDYLMLNHRDHRKITVIDSTIGYGGGINIADEYINVIERFGVWKDTGFRLEGEGVWGLTTTFLQTWEFVSGAKADYSRFRPDYGVKSDCIVQPYFDTPLDKINLCANTYLNVVNNAKDYVYIASPYLIVDNEVLTAITLAARSGVDVRVIVPGIPDKWYVYYVTQSYYKPLLEAGVKVYEYTPGFLHAKMYVSDDMQAIVGGANTDYRSLYLNFENCCAFYGGEIVSRVKKDFDAMFRQSHLVTAEDIRNTPLYKRIFQIAFRVLSPLM